MAKKRWATFSAVDHLDIRTLVPDVLLFDRLVFPYPANKDELAYWEARKWEPKLLDWCVLMLEELAYLVQVEWSGMKREAPSANGLRRTIFEKLDYQEELDYKKASADEISESGEQIRQVVFNERRNDLWVMPRYRSRESFLQDQHATMTVADQTTRREALALLIGQKMTVPLDADPKVALRLAIDLARDDSYQRSRRALNNWQEAVIWREQSAKDDAQDLADLVSDLNRHLAKVGAKTRQQWVFYALKRVLGLESNILISLGNATMDIAEIVRKQGDEIPEGPMGVFQHVRKRVIEAL
jgi:hypothetical protein